MPYAPRRPCPTPRCPHRQPCPVHPTGWAKVNAQGTAQSRGYRSSAWPRIAREYLEAHPWCERCDLPAASVDHRIPKSQGGTDDEENLQALCDRCHRSKTGREGRGAR